ncbi:MAG: 5'-nucleotidase [Gammaproteobacteria bacterium]|jgi:5'-nucleotidase|nr:5'-nucleotidase [Gammaproteobacteria bacterium]
MSNVPAEKLVVAISSRALFNLDDSHEIYMKEGVEAYRQYQIDREDEVLEPGDAFSLVKKLLNLNTLIGKQWVEVILLSRNSADTGLRIFNSIEQHKLDIQKAAFCGGSSPYRYITAFNSHLFLSTDGQDVRKALENGIAAATILNSKQANTEDYKLRFAFDGDAVLFSDEAERVYKTQGLEEFARSERAAAKEPLTGGPFKKFLSALHMLQQEFGVDDSPIRTCLVTARAAPAHERVVRTLRQWNINIDESLFLGGQDKGAFLRAYDADVFFDDQQAHCESTREHVATGHVPHGIANLVADKS